MAQLALPRLAEREVTERLGGKGEVTEAKVEALPAIELLWHRADSVSAHVRSYDVRADDLVDDLVQTAAVKELDVRIDRVRASGEMELRDVRVSKRDGVLHGSALLDPDQLAKALPAGVEGRLVGTDGEQIVVDARIAGAPVRLRVLASDGRVLARPEGVLGFLTGYTVFADPRVAVERIGARRLPDGRWALSAQARVR